MDDANAAVEIWNAARVAAGEPPTAARMARVRTKVAEPAARLVVAHRDGRPVGMLLAEPFREGRGAGDPRPGWGHVSMVFVHPDHQDAGVGSELLHRLVDGGPWAHLSLWTRCTNHRARGLYRACGFVETDDDDALSDGERIRRWERASTRS